jgi:hypothetical protein
METSESYRTSVLPVLTGRGATAARALLVAGPVALLGAQLMAFVQAASNAEAALSRAAVPLMLAWAAVLFLVTRAAAPVAAWTGLVAVTLQVTLVQEVTDGWLLLLVESLAFVAFAVALQRLSWVPRAVPALMVAVPMLDLLTREHAGLPSTAAFALVVAVGLLLAWRLNDVVGGDAPVERPWVGRTSARLSARTAGAGTPGRLPVRSLPPLG